MNIVLVETKNELDQFYRDVNASPFLSLDIETEGLSWYFHEIKVVSIGCANDNVYIFRWEDYKKHIHGYVRNMQFVMHNKLFDETFLMSRGLIFSKPVWCTQTQAFLNDPTSPLALSKRVRFIDMDAIEHNFHTYMRNCLLYTSPSPRDS